MYMKRKPKAQARPKIQMRDVEPWDTEQQRFRRNHIAYMFPTVTSNSIKKIYLMVSTFQLFGNVFFLSIKVKRASALWLRIIAKLKLVNNQLFELYGFCGMLQRLTMGLLFTAVDL